MSGEQPIEKEVVAKAVQGSKLSSDEVTDLESRLRASPMDIDSRIRLLGYYLKHACANRSHLAPRCNHVVWFVSNAPSHPILRTPFGQVSRQIECLEPYKVLESLWLARTEEFGEDVNVLLGAADFFISSDCDFSERILLKALSLEPDNFEVRWRLTSVQGRPKPCDSDV